MKEKNEIVRHFLHGQKNQILILNILLDQLAEELSLSKSNKKQITAIIKQMNEKAQEIIAANDKLSL